LHADDNCTWLYLKGLSAHQTCKSGDNEFKEGVTAYLYKLETCYNLLFTEY